MMQQENATAVQPGSGSGLEEAPDSPIRSGQLTLVFAQRSDTGRVRSHNEDAMGHLIPPDGRQRARKGAIYLVADGMGGHQAGEVASRQAIAVSIERYFADGSRDVTTSLVRALRAANREIYEQAQADPSKAGMGTTLVAAVIVADKVYVANVGDSRAYVLGEQGIAQVTDDHSWVSEQVRAGLLTPDQARGHPQRNLVTRALGTRPSVEIDVFEGAIAPGDVVLLCSDGLTNLLEDEEIAAILRQHPPEEAAQALVEAANQRGGPDNITVMVVAAAQESPGAEPARSRPAWLERLGRALRRGGGSEENA
jgi:serine/threonine protein phosphatase PrpC